MAADERGPGCGMALMGEAEADARLDAALAEKKPGDRDALWLFAYGALMWRPEFPVAERRAATVRGWHRRFCLWQPGFRGTPERPGVMLALDRGGRCRGFAYRIAGPDLREAVRPVWRREMRGRGYEARWIAVGTADGPVPALAFVADRAGTRYAGRLTDEAIAGHIAAACGPTGPSAEYLLNTVAACEAGGPARPPPLDPAGAGGGAARGSEQPDADPRLAPRRVAVGTGRDAVIGQDRRVAEAEETARRRSGDEDVGLHLRLEGDGRGWGRRDPAGREPGSGAPRIAGGHVGGGRRRGGQGSRQRQAGQHRAERHGSKNLGRIGRTDKLHRGIPVPGS